MFQFLCAEGECNFRNFIDTHGFDFKGDNYLTADFLWDYFFQEYKPERDNAFSEAVSHYNNFAPLCQNESQRRVLKTTLILSGLQQKNMGVRGKASSLLRATVKNISACFAGVPLENDVRQTLNFFVDKGIISALEEPEDTYYIMTSTQIDRDRLEKIVEQIRRNQSFAALIKDETYGATKKFKPPEQGDYLRYRLNVRIISPTKYLQSGPTTFHIADNQIPTFYIFAEDEAEQGKVNPTIQKLRKKFPERCIIADFSATPFTRRRYEKFLQNRARELYFNEVPNQAGQVRIAKKVAAAVVEEWGNLLGMSAVRVWTSREESTQVSCEGNFLRLLRELNRNFFGAGLEEISTNGQLFQPNNLTENVARHAFSIERIKGAYSWLNFLGDSFRELIGRGGENYWQTNPSHTISKMKRVVEGVLERGLETRNEVALSEIWDALKRSPVGLFKCPGSIFILTVLLKDYADKNFYIRDMNGNTSTLTGERLCTLVVNTVKELPQAQDKFIVKQTPEHVKFCRVTGEIFNVPAEKVKSVYEAAKNVKVRLSQSHYPLWSLKYFVEANYPADARKDVYLRFLTLTDEFVNPQSGRDVTTVADDIFSLYDKNPKITDELKIIVQDENFRLDMTIYLEQYKPELKSIIESLKLTESESLSRLQEKFSEARGALDEKLNKILLPRAIAEEFQPELKILFQTLASLHNDSENNFCPSGAANQ